MTGGQRLPVVVTGREDERIQAAVQSRREPILFDVASTAPRQGQIETTLDKTVSLSVRGIRLVAGVALRISG